MPMLAIHCQREPNAKGEIKMTAKERRNSFHSKDRKNCRSPLPANHRFIHPGSFYIPAQLIVLADATTTANKIMASMGLFRMGIGTELVSC